MLEDPTLDVDLEGFRVVLDCANGAVGAIALPPAFYNLGVQASFLANEPDGFNINEACGATDPEAMRREVVRRGADLGFSFDGDGDRVILADEEGGLVDGDSMLAILALDLAARGQLSVPIVVGTVLSNFGLEKCLAAHGIELVRTPVGDRHVAEKMAETGALLGGEPSGHIVFGDRQGLLTGDGLYTALRVLAVIARTGSSLAQLASVCQAVPQIQLAVPIRERIPFEDVPAVAKELKNARRALGKNGRVLLRYSGTEDVARVMVEGVDEAKVREHAERLAGAVAQAIGAVRRASSAS